MEAAVLTGLEAWLQQGSTAPRGRSLKTPLQVTKAKTRVHQWFLSGDDRSRE